MTVSGQQPAGEEKKWEHGRYGDGVCGVAPDGLAQRHLGEERPMGPPGQDALEKYFLMKMKRGVSEPFFEKAILDAIGITKREERPT